MDDEGGKWLTFAELAATRGTSKRAAVMLIRRHGWRRQRNNAGHTIALVPPMWLQRTTDDADGNGDGHSTRHGSGHSDGHAASFHARALAALEDAMSSLRDAHTDEVSALQAAHAGETAALRDRLDDMRRDLDAARAETQRVQDDAAARTSAALALADRTLAQLADADGRADRAEARADALQDRLAAAEADADRARAQAHTAQDELRQADVARRARGRWARLRAAWRGE